MNAGVQMRGLIQDELLHQVNGFTEPNALTYFAQTHMEALAEVVGQGWPVLLD